MLRAALEIADIFRAHGSAWRTANAGHISLGQLKVPERTRACERVLVGQIGSFPIFKGDIGELATRWGFRPEHFVHRPRHRHHRLPAAQFV